MWLYRRMLRIAWTDRIRNTEVLSRMGKEMEVLYDIKRRKLQYFGHVIRNSKRRPGRRRTSWLKNLREWFGMDSASLFRATASKIKIAVMIANLRRGEGN
ncbi:UNVERIFIED_CONTAM: hypothetical protein PYX00_005000 [Menopon gallinae]|uniref:Uncharacterized protein n=1 Tax=Menopon gallinae TaxID=328185 RepID=A0AAW2I6P3_9NEOP